MRKYVLLSVFLFLSFILLGYNNVFAIAVDASGCGAGSFSTTTGKPCSPVSVPGCEGGYKFSPLSGRPCTSSLSSSAESSGAPAEASGLTNQLFNRELGVGAKGQDVKALQQFLKDSGLLNGSVDGSYGPITRGAVVKYQQQNSLTPNGRADTAIFAHIKQIPWERMCPIINKVYGVSYPCPTPISLPVLPPCPLVKNSDGSITHECQEPTPIPCPAIAYADGRPVPCPKPTNGPVISGVSGPQSLSVGQEGTWTVKASDASGGVLYYSVIWGDENSYADSAMGSSYKSVAEQSATFTHSYEKARVYNPTFVVASELVANCIQAPCPSEKKSAKTSTTVKVRQVTDTSSLSLLSPNGGEVWAKGTTQVIKWQENDPISYPSICLPGSSASSCVTFAPRLYDIQLASYYPPCTGRICPMYDIQTKTIAEKVSGYSYKWTIPNCTATNTCSSNFEIPAGLYTIHVCETGSTRCDSSDKYFEIVNALPTATQYGY